MERSHDDRGDGDDGGDGGDGGDGYYDDDGDGSFDDGAYCGDDGVTGTGPARSSGLVYVVGARGVNARLYCKSKCIHLRIDSCSYVFLRVHAFAHVLALVLTMLHCVASGFAYAYI